MLREVQILIVDDEVEVCKNLKDILSEDGYRVTAVGTVSEAKKELAGKRYNLALVDLKLQDGSGLDLLADVKRIDENVMVIVCTGFASLESAIFAIQEGAFGYLQKPLNVTEMRLTIKKALRMQALDFENKNLLNKLKELSLKDPLTGLYNYRYLMERLSFELKRAHRHVLPLSLVMLDIDYFKAINDAYGHHYGDLVLKETAQCLLDCARGNDIVVRYGGEEFVIILPDTAKDGALMLGRRVLDAVKRRVFIQDKKIRLKVSLGIVSFPEDGAEGEAGLLDSADQALRDAKELGGNRLAVFRSAAHKDMENALGPDERENISRLKEKLLKMENRVNHSLLESIYAFAKTIETRDYYTGEDTEMMASLVTKIGKEFNLSGTEMENLRRAAILHDLGKIGIPDRILGKKEKLAEQEYEEIKKHPHIGADLISSIHFLNEVVYMVLYHHERYDGLGYAAGLKGEEIPLGARIIAVADVYHALISDRPYRKALEKEEALKVIAEGSGTQFDPEVVKAFLTVINAEP